MNPTMHPFHLTTPSPWPIVISMSIMSCTFMLISSFQLNSVDMNLIIIMTFIITLNSTVWWRDLKRESSLQGFHTNKFLKMIKISMIMFIISEVMLFFSFFWTFFHSSMSPSIELGSTWPPIYIQPFNAMGMPLLNSILLLSSGASITWSHHSFLSKMYNQSLISMLITISLGTLFTICQGVEYMNSKFSFSDSSFGSTLFLMTGFHGIHVLIGSMFISSTTLSIYSLMNSSNHFISFDLSSWYWHFVDIVWLFLYISIYWWGSM